MSLFSIVLHEPDIPGNTGSIGRTCVALNARLILIKPYGFSLDEKSVRRAGLDYWKYVDLTEYDNFESYFEAEQPQNFHLFSKLGEKSLFETELKKDCHLIFGSETRGLPQKLFEKYPEQFLSLPMYSDKIRSLNLSNCATAVAYEAIRQIKF
jgi:tRNA (cytidine/uridine-2'-O-)-methyltransferase